MNQLSLGKQFKNDFKKFKSFTKTSNFYYILIALVFVFLSPLLFTQLSFISFENTGPIGDTIGGITAPFVNLIAAYLVYKSFKAQIDSNNLLRKETTFNFVSQLTDRVLKNVEEENLNIDSRYVARINSKSRTCFAFYNSVLNKYKDSVVSSNLEFGMNEMFDEKLIKIEYILDSLKQLVDQIDESLEDNSLLKTYFFRSIYEFLKNKELFEHLNDSSDILIKIENDKIFIDKSRYIHISSIYDKTRLLSSVLQQNEDEIGGEL